MSPNKVVLLKCHQIKLSFLTLNRKSKITDATMSQSCTSNVAKILPLAQSDLLDFYWIHCKNRQTNF